MSVDDILKERGAVYGEFFEQARLTLALKNPMRIAYGWTHLAPDQKEAAEMICVKLARIINGNPDYADNWHDIAGYATLVANRLEKKEKE